MRLKAFLSDLEESPGEPVAEYSLFVAPYMSLSMSLNVKELTISFLGD